MGSLRDFVSEKRKLNIFQVYLYIGSCHWLQKIKLYIILDLDFTFRLTTQITMLKISVVHI